MAGMGRVQIKTYMRHVINDHRDPATNEINATKLAEDAAEHFGIVGEPPDIFFECAEDLASNSLTGVVRNLINSRDSSWF